MTNGDLLIPLEMETLGERTKTGVARSRDNEERPAGDKFSIFGYNRPLAYLGGTFCREEWGMPGTS
ncbi:MAG: hypothetical protein EXS18_00560 [Verrucomicrobiae bacterium]|nr:hypothetical protein [Verrucomicrobiae bacterium]